MVWPGFSRGGDRVIKWGAGFLPTGSAEAPILQSINKSEIWLTGIMFRWIPFPFPFRQEILTLIPSSTTVRQSLPIYSHWLNLFTEGTEEYVDCDGLLNDSSDVWPQSALFQIAASGIPLSKLVIGKPGTSGDASNGFISTSILAQCVQQAKNRGWSEYYQISTLLNPSWILQVLVSWSGNSPMLPPTGSDKSALLPSRSKYCDKVNIVTEIGIQSTQVKEVNVY